MYFDIDYSKITKTKIFENYGSVIVKDLNDVHYISVYYAIEILHIQKPNFYKLIKRGNLEVKDFGNSKFVTIDSLMKEVERRAQKQLNAIRAKKLKKIFNESEEEEHESYFKRLKAEERREKLKKILSKEELEQMLSEMDNDKKE